MKKCFAATAVTPLIAMIGLVVATKNASADRTFFELHDRRIVGNELRLVVQTYRTWTPFFSHSSRTADAKGYIIVVDLASTKPLKERTRIYGPLWEVPNERSSISFQSG